MGMYNYFSRFSGFSGTQGWKKPMVFKINILFFLFFFGFYSFLMVLWFLRASAMLKHVIDIGWTSVCPSVRLSVCHTLAPYQNG